MDVSFACYATDYIYAAYCFKTAMNIRKYIVAHGSKLKTPQQSYIYRTLSMYCILSSASLLLGGIFHQFPKKQLIFDIAGGINGVASVLFMLVLCMTFFNIPETLRNWIMGSTKFIPILIIFERLVLKVANFKVLLIVCYFIGFLVSFVTTPKHILAFKTNLFRIGCFTAVLTAISYLVIEQGCREPNAYELGKCILPDEFNHNALAHCLFMFCFHATITPYLNLA